MRLPFTTKTLMITTGTIAVGATLILLRNQELPWTNASRSRTST